MTLSSGTRLGPCEVLAPLGAGGMGEVYRARDTRLEREVAIKVLPAELASDAERLRRFEKDSPIRFTADGKALFVERRGELETSVYRVELQSGRPELHLKIAPADVVGIDSLGEVRITPDGRSYVYSIERCLSELYLVEGLR